MKYAKHFQPGEKATWHRWTEDGNFEGAVSILTQYRGGYQPELLEKLCAMKLGPRGGASKLRFDMGYAVCWVTMFKSTVTGKLTYDGTVRSRAIEKERRTWADYERRDAGKTLW